MQSKFDPISKTSAVRIFLPKEAAKSPQSADIWLNASKSESVLEPGGLAPHVVVGCE